MRRREFITLIGGAAAWPLAARAHAQHAVKARRIAIVHPSFQVSEMSLTGHFHYRVFFRQLALRGYVEGQNLVVDRYSAQGQTDVFAELARKVVRSNPDLIYAVSGRLVLEFVAATTTIPIVAAMADPVAAGIAPSLARPGGNVTGVGFEALWDKRLEILKETVPSLLKVGYFASVDVWRSVFMAPVREAFDRAGVSLIGPPLARFSEPECRKVFEAMMMQGVDGLVVSDQPELYTGEITRIVPDLANEVRLPAIYPWREFVDAGGLMSYSNDFTEIALRRAEQVSQILDGVLPADLPWQLVTKILLIINLRTANAFGLTLPLALLTRADEVIE